MIVRAPPPDEDVGTGRQTLIVQLTPFLVPCVVSRGDFRCVTRSLYRLTFRRLGEFRVDGPACTQERGLFVWYAGLVDPRPTTTLRELANLLYIAEPSTSRPISLHDFRLIYQDRVAGEPKATAPVLGVTRITSEQKDALLQPFHAPKDARAILKGVDRDHIKMHERDPAMHTLLDLGFTPGDVLECAIRSSEPRERRRERSPDSRQRAGRGGGRWHERSP